MDQKVQNWVKKATEFLATFPALDLGDTVSMPTYSSAKAEYEELHKQYEDLVAKGAVKEDAGEVPYLHESVRDRWVEYDYATKMPTGGRNRKRKTRKGKKRTTRRKKTSRR